MIYVRVDSENIVVEISPEEKPQFILVDDENAPVDFTQLMYKALYVENGVLKRRPVVVPYYQRRVNEYPPIGDQLDALWKLIKANADKIDLAEAATLFDAVQAVKDKYPKPV